MDSSQATMEMIPFNPTRIENEDNVSGDNAYNEEMDRLVSSTLPILTDSTLTNDDPDTPPPSYAPPLQRGSSVASSLSFTDACRICHCEGEPTAPLISPCSCSGTLKFVHQACLQQWIKSANTKSCELCKLDFQMTTSVKPFSKWQKLDMTKVERRKIVCSVTFHVIAITCVVWSLYVLIERTTEEIQAGKLEWPFWTKLVVVAIGFTGGLVFMYVQCKMYAQLCRRWRAYNRVIYVQDCPMTARNARKGNTVSGGGFTTAPSNNGGSRKVAATDTCELQLV